TADRLADDVDMVFCSTDVGRSKQVGQKIVHSSIEPRWHDIHVDRDMHEVDRHGDGGGGGEVFGGGKVFGGGEVFGGSVVFSGDGVGKGVDGEVQWRRCRDYHLRIGIRGVELESWNRWERQFRQMRHAGNDDFLGVQIKAPISTMIVRVPEKDRWCGKFMPWKGVRVTKASKCAKVGVRGQRLRRQRVRDIDHSCYHNEEGFDGYDKLVQ
nr:hypothetical protein [Tanacetum cinerariifolium]